jgi:hypothetical protein
VDVLDEQSQSAIRNSVTEVSNQSLATANDALRFHPWITQELFDESRRVWSKAYGRVITDDEVIEILVNVHRLAEALLHASQSRRDA